MKFSIPHFSKFGSNTEFCPKSTINDTTINSIDIALVSLFLTVGKTLYSFLKFFCHF